MMGSEEQNVPKTSLKYKAENYLCFISRIEWRAKSKQFRRFETEFVLLFYFSFISLVPGKEVDLYSAYRQ